MARILVPRQRQQVGAGPGTQPLPEHPPVGVGQLTHGGDAELMQLRFGDRPDSPYVVDGQRVEEGDLVFGVDHLHAVGLGVPAPHLGQELGAGRTD